MSTKCYLACKIRKGAFSKEMVYEIPASTHLEWESNFGGRWNFGGGWVEAKAFVGLSHPDHLLNSRKELLTTADLQGAHPIDGFVCCRKRTTYQRLYRGCNVLAVVLPNDKVLHVNHSRLVFVVQPEERTLQDAVEVEAKRMERVKEMDKLLSWQQGRGDRLIATSNHPGLGCVYAIRTEPAADGFYYLAVVNGEACETIRSEEISELKELAECCERGIREVLRGVGDVLKPSQQPAPPEAGNEELKIALSLRNTKVATDDKGAKKTEKVGLLTKGDDDLVRPYNALVQSKNVACDVQQLVLYHTAEGKPIFSNYWVVTFEDVEEVVFQELLPGARVETVTRDWNGMGTMMVFSSV